MNVKEGLTEIRRRLVENGARPESIRAVDAVLERASLPGASGATAGSLLQLVRMLMRSPIASSKPAVYNDFVRLESELETQAAEVRARRDEEESRPMPKPKKYYKELKKKQGS